MDRASVKAGAPAPYGMERLAGGKVLDVSLLDDALFSVGDGEGVERDPDHCVVGAVDRVEEDGALLPAHLGVPEFLADQAPAERMAREVVHDDLFCNLIDLLRGRAVRAHPYVLPCFRRSGQTGYCVPDNPCQVVACPDEFCQLLLVPPLVLTVYLCTAIQIH